MARRETASEKKERLAREEEARQEEARKVREQLDNLANSNSEIKGISKDLDDVYEKWKAGKEYFKKRDDILEDFQKDRQYFDEATGTTHRMRADERDRELEKLAREYFDKMGGNWSDDIYDEMTRLGLKANDIANRLGSDFDGYVERLQSAVGSDDFELNPFGDITDSLNYAKMEMAERMSKHDNRYITRVVVGKTCDYCFDREYSGKYSDMPDWLKDNGGIFSVHKGCDCEIEVQEED